MEIAGGHRQYGTVVFLIHRSNNELNKPIISSELHAIYIKTSQLGTLTNILKNYFQCLGDIWRQ